MARLAACAVAACISWNAAALRIDPVADGKGDLTMCIRMDMPESMGMRTEDVGRADPNLYQTKPDPKHDYVEVDDVADFNLHNTNDVADFEHLRNANILFIGDSTVEELMWDTLYTLNETADDQGWVDVPAAECHYQKCSDICGGRDYKTPHQRFHNLGRCSHTGTPECMKRMSNVARRNVTLGFIWAASPYICCNGYPGLYGAMHNPDWMDMFREYVARAPYDYIVMSTGTHDFYGAQNDTQYITAVNTIMMILDPLAKHHVLVNPQGGHPNEINHHIVSHHHPNWRVIDRIRFHEHLHCNKVHYTLSYFHYKRSKECHGLVNEIFNPKLVPEVVREIK